MRKRSRAREFALQILYQWELSQSGIEEVLEDFWKDKSEVALEDSEKKTIQTDKQDSEIRGYAETLGRGTTEHCKAIDEAIVRHAENWSLSRMAIVDRNILRISTYEMTILKNIPEKVSINEAVELAKRYGEPDSSKFVNGILDKIAKTECDL